MTSNCFLLTTEVHSLLGQLDDEVPRSVLESKEGVAVVVVVHDELAAFEDRCQDNYKQGGDGRRSLQRNKQNGRQNRQNKKKS